jgi:hypothetical protein
MRCDADKVGGMLIHHRLPLSCLAAALALATQPASAQELLYSDNFDTNTASQYTINADPDTSVFFNYDYSQSPFGIPSAPNSVDGTTRGVRFEANNGDLTAAAAAINISPTGQVFTGDYISSLTTAQPFKINLWSLSPTTGEDGLIANFDPEGMYSWTIATAPNLVGTFDPALFVVNREAVNGTGGFQNSDAGFFQVAMIGNDLVVQYAIPEASTAMLLGLGAAGFFARRRR